MHDLHFLLSNVQHDRDPVDPARSSLQATFSDTLVCVFSSHDEGLGFLVVGVSTLTVMVISSGREACHLCNEDASWHE